MHEHYAQLFQDDAQQAASAREFSARVFEWSDFMVNVLAVKLADLGPPVKVTYHPSCHLLRDMGVREAPLQYMEVRKECS